MAVLAALIIIIASAAYFLWRQAQSYSVVYLATGEIYIGKLAIFPRLELDSAYILQVVKDEKDPAKSNFQMTPLSEAIWAPKTLYLNSKQVVFYGPVSETSKVAETIKNAKK